MYSIFLLGEIPAAASRCREIRDSEWQNDRVSEWRSSLGRVLPSLHLYLYLSDEGCAWDTRTWKLFVYFEFLLVCIRTRSCACVLSSRGRGASVSGGFATKEQRRMCSPWRAAGVDDIVLYKAPEESLAGINLCCGAHIFFLFFKREIHPRRYYYSFFSVALADRRVGAGRRWVVGEWEEEAEEYKRVRRGI